jgi:hypothetical protein
MVPCSTNIAGHEQREKHTMELKPITENAVAEPAGIVPTALLRPILTVPRNNAPADPPLYVFVCPHSGSIQLITEAITILPTVVQANGACPYCTAEKLAAQRPWAPFERRTLKPKGGPTPCAHPRATVLLRFGQELFVGEQLVRGYPDKLPMALRLVLADRFAADVARGQRHTWLLCPPIILADGSEAA